MLKTIPKISAVTALSFASMFAFGVFVGILVPNNSNSAKAEFANAPLTFDAQPQTKKRRIVRVVEKPTTAPVACDVSTSSENPIENNSAKKYVYKEGEKVITKTCQPPAEKSAKMPNLFKE